MTIELVGFGVEGVSIEMSSPRSEQKQTDEHCLVSCYSGYHCYF